MLRLFNMLLLTTLLAMPVIAAAQDGPKYGVVLDAQKQEVAVTLCLAQAHAQVSFEADSDDAMRFIHDARRTDGRALDARDGEWRATDWKAGDCLSYRADLAAIAAENDSDVGLRLGDDLVTAPQFWLLRPDVQGDADAQLQITLPASLSISAPWHEVAREGGSIRFHIINTPPNWSAAVAIGHFDEVRIELPGGVLRLAILHGADAEQKKKLHDWLAHVSRAVLSARMGACRCPMCRC